MSSPGNSGPDPSGLPASPGPGSPKQNPTPTDEVAGQQGSVTINLKESPMKTWIHSIVAAAIAAFSTSVTAAIADPSSFNFSAKGFEHIAAVGGLSAVVAVLALLKKSPLPGGAA